MPPLRCPIDLNQPDKAIVNGQLRLGGQDPSGNTLGANNTYLTRNGRPLFLISGEFHFSRFPAAHWEEELLKIKAGGVNTVATYVFWICHEEKMGEFDWRGDKDLRGFVEACGRHGLQVVLRVGPFAHGEWRNGGLPDWLYGQPFEARSNDPRYLAHVARYFGAIAGQVRGLWFADGGPIVGLQLENEYMHTGAPWEVVEAWRQPEWVPKGQDGAGHLTRLQTIAQQAGLNAPYCFITAWGGSPIIEEESLPVYVSYAYPTWVDRPAPSEAYVFRDRHARPVEAPTHQTPYHYPFLMAEQQGGIQITYENRPIVPPRSTEAMALVSLGAGCNGLGYYMYHGGTTPRGGHGFSQERGLPQLSYDFQAPIGEYGQTRASYRYLKILHLFLEAYGEVLAPMGTLLPENAPATLPADTALMRYCARARGGSGFLFVNNFQDHVERADFNDVVFELDTPQGKITLPETTCLSLPKDGCAVFPFNQSLEGARLVYATVQPLTVIHTAGYTHYFYFVPEAGQPEYCFEANSLTGLAGEFEEALTGDQRLYVRPTAGRDHSFSFVSEDGRPVVVTTLTRHEAEHTWKGPAWSRERVILCEAGLVFAQGGVQVNALDTAEVTLTVFPGVETPVRVNGSEVVAEPFARGTRLRLPVPARPLELQVEACGAGKYQLSFPADAWSGASDIFLRIEYEGDTGAAFVDGRLIADNFCNGLPWEIGLKRFGPEALEKGICLVFRPSRRGVVRNISSSAAARFDFEGTERLLVHPIQALREYSAWLEA